MSDYLAEELLSRIGAAKPAQIERLIASAMAEGGLTPDRRGFWVIPARASKVFGNAPVVVKPLSASVSEYKRLVTIITFLREVRYPAIAPHWVGEGHIVCPFYANSIDLGLCLSAWPRYAGDIYRSCTDFLEYFMNEVPCLQRELLLQGLDSHNPFPFSARYLRAVKVISAHFGNPAAEAIAKAGPGLLDSKTWRPFVDAKPANFLVPRNSISDGIALAPIRIDLDMLRYDVPFALECIVVFFSIPMGGFEHGDNSWRLLARFEAVAETVASVEDLRLEDLIRLLWYHLLRNFTSALTLANRTKALAMRRFLLDAACVFPCLGIGKAFSEALTIGDMLLHNSDQGGLTT